jgi:signal peptidase I
MTEIQRPKWQENLKLIADIVYNFAIIVVIVAAIRYTLISPFQVNGSSMLPTLETSEFLMVDKLSYFLHNPERGDIVVLIPPENTETFYVKRIIGLPGEKIEFLNGQVIIHNTEHPEGLRLEEPYLSPENKDTYLPTRENKIIPIPENNFFVMGDNRHASNDSRSWGILHRQSIEGKAWFVFLPLNRMHFMQHAEYENTGN